LSNTDLWTAASFVNSVANPDHYIDGLDSQVATNMLSAITQGQVQYMIEFLEQGFVNPTQLQQMRSKGWFLSGARYILHSRTFSKLAKQGLLSKGNVSLNTFVSLDVIHPQTSYEVQPLCSRQ
jgi:hypothetical protein